MVWRLLVRVRAHFVRCVVLGGTEIIVEICGGRAVSARAVGGGGDGDARLLAQITWTDA